MSSRGIGAVGTIPDRDPRLFRGCAIRGRLSAGAPTMKTFLPVALTVLTGGLSAQPGPPAPLATGPLRVYVAGESIEVRNRYVAPPFTQTGALNDRGGGALRNDNEEYGWMVPLRDRLRLRAPDLFIEFVGSG